MKGQTLVPPLRVAMVARRETGMTGTGRYVCQLADSLGSLGLAVRMIRPDPLPAGVSRPMRRFGIDIKTFAATYPMRLAPPLGDEVDVYHLATQNLATLLLFQRFHRPVVVTVHDIIPYLVRDDRQLSAYAHPIHRFFDLLAMRGLKRADRLLADSNWTKDTLVRGLGIAPNRIDVAYLGVDLERFRPLRIPDSFWERYGLSPHNRLLLYVGSEDPRKNLGTLLRAFSALSRKHPDLRLVKVGAPHHRDEHKRLIALAGDLGIASKVHWVSQVPDDDLPWFYNAAQLAILPSRYEGFGLSVLESMACGTRVVCSSSAALPEVAGCDSIMCPPTVEALAQAVAAGVAGEGAAEPEDRRRWASQFTWARTAERARESYTRARDPARRQR